MPVRYIGKPCLVANFLHSHAGVAICDQKLLENACIYLGNFAPSQGCLFVSIEKTSLLFMQSSSCIDTGEFRYAAVEALCEAAAKAWARAERDKGYPFSRVMDQF